ncbi:MAG TPA: carboxylesterase family protein [Pseudolabrys sp.]|nr:carboxylesterase family protein [Pseudolabrys sp.]
MIGQRAALLGTFLLVFLLLCGVAAPAKADPSLIVGLKSCPSASVVGSTGPFPNGAGGDMRAFLGVPYAAPPTGANRWLPPKKFCWSGQRDAGQAKSGCPASYGGDEDCLYLNIFTPWKNGLTKMPVMVFIHGGALTSGSAFFFGQNPYNLVAKNVIVVLIDYRLGALGFLAHPALDNVAGQRTGNYGMLDQVAALKWIKANIAAFDGDPNNITIFGQSAGGLSVLTHLVSPLSKGLFQKAIVESGSFYYAPTLLSAAETQGKTFAANVGCGSGSSTAVASCLRKLPVSTIVANQGVLGSSTSLIKQDGIVLKDSIKNLLVTGQFQKVPIINGSNHDEARFHLSTNAFGIGTGDMCHFASNLVPNAQANFSGAVKYSDAVTSLLSSNSPSLPALALKKYPSGATPLSANEAFAAIYTDRSFACRQFRASKFIAGNGGKIWTYELNDQNAPVWSQGPLTVHGGAKMPYGDYHNAELQYIFPMPKTVACGLKYPGLSAAQKKLANDMVIYWTTFAKTGDPNPTAGSKPPAWPKFTGATGKILSLVSAAPVSVAAKTFDTAHKCSSFWDKYTE